MAFRTAMPEQTLGLRQPIANMRPEDRRRVAYHEAGHALAACVFQPEHRIGGVSIVRYGEARGHGDHKPLEERHTLTREALRLNREVLDRIVAVLMEREEIGFEEVQAIFAECGCKLPVPLSVPERAMASVNGSYPGIITPATHARCASAPRTPRGSLRSCPDGAARAASAGRRLGRAGQPRRTGRAGATRRHTCIQCPACAPVRDRVSERRPVT